MLSTKYFFPDLLNIFWQTIPTHVHNSVANQYHPRTSRCKLVKYFVHDFEERLHCIKSNCILINIHK